MNFDVLSIILWKCSSSAVPNCSSIDRVSTMNTTIVSLTLLLHSDVQHLRCALQTVRCAHYVCRLSLFLPLSFFYVKWAHCGFLSVISPCWVSFAMNQANLHATYQSVVSALCRSVLRIIINHATYTVSHLYCKNALIRFHIDFTCILFSFLIHTLIRYHFIDAQIRISCWFLRAYPTSIRAQKNSFSR